MYEYLWEICSAPIVLIKLLIKSHVIDVGIALVYVESNIIDDYNS